MSDKTEMFVQKAKLKLSAAKTRLFGLMLYPLKIVTFNDKKSTIEGFVRYEPNKNRYENTIYINSEFVENIKNYTTSNMVDILLHELNHIVRRHDIRKGDRDPKIWNIATDHIIDLSLKKFNISKPSISWNIIQEIEEDERYQSEETVYDWLFNRAIKISDNGDGTISVALPNGQHFTTNLDLSNDSLTPEQKQSIENYISQVRAIYNIERERGTISSNIGELLNKLLEVHVPWEVLLDKAIKKNAFEKTSRKNWKTPNKFLYYPTGIYLPGKVKTYENTGIGTLLIHIDSSGSISKDKLSKAGKVIYESAKYFNKINLIIADIEIHQNKDFTKNNFDEIMTFFTKEGIKGRGGTSHAYVFDYWQKYIEKNPDEVSLMITITDAYSDIDSEILRLKALNYIPMIALCESNSGYINPHKNITKILID